MGNRYFGLGQIEWMEGGGGHCRDGRGGIIKTGRRGVEDGRATVLDGEPWRRVITEG